MEQTYIVPEDNLPRLLEEVDRLNKRAKKLGTKPITLTSQYVYTDYEYRHPKTQKVVWWSSHEVSYDQAGRKVVGPARPRKSDDYVMTGRVRVWSIVTVKGESPKYEGWALVGCLEPLTLDDGTTENIVRTVPGCTVPSVYRDRVGYCDHCNTKRKRTETFVVQHDDRSTRMVGRQCIKDFLGHADPHALAKLAELLMDLDGLCLDAQNEDWLGGGSRVPESWDLTRFLDITIAVTRLEGWMSRGRAHEICESGGRATATADYVLHYLTPPLAGTEAHKDWQKWRDQVDSVPQEPVTGAEVVEWAKDLEVSEGEDYLYNLNLIARCGYVKRKTAGLAGSMAQAYRRAKGLLDDQRKGPRPVSQHVGKVGDKLECDVTCDRVHATEGMYGTTGIHNMTDEDGNVLVWFASGSTTWLTEGSKFRIKGTIKGHNDYKGQNQTALTRVKILRDYTEEQRVQEHEKTTT